MRSTCSRSYREAEPRGTGRSRKTVDRIRPRGNGLADPEAQDHARRQLPGGAAHGQDESRAAGSREDEKKAAAGFAAAQPVATVRVPARKVRSVSRSARSKTILRQVQPGGRYLQGQQRRGRRFGQERRRFPQQEVVRLRLHRSDRIEFKDGARSRRGRRTATGGPPAARTSIRIDSKPGRQVRDLAATKFVEGSAAQPAIEITVVSDSGKRTEKLIAPRVPSSWEAAKGMLRCISWNAAAVSGLRQADGRQGNHNTSEARRKE